MVDISYLEVKLSGLSRATSVYDPPPPLVFHPEESN